MHNQEILWVAAAAAFFVFIMIASVRKRQPLPSRLHLKSEPLRDLGRQSATIDSATREVINQSFNRPKDSIRELNTIFMYNGHSWDAYEVLGIPAGAGPDLIEKAYRAGLAKTQANSHEFLNCAYQAITKK
jgi:hypothetical protein